MNVHKWKLRLISIFIVATAVLSILLFPILAKNQYTFSQIKQNKQKTMEKYANIWSNTTIKHTSIANQPHAYGDQVATITIPKMNIYELPVYYGSDPVNNNWQITTPGHAGNWSMFGEAGVTCVGAHNYQLFKDLQKLESGDKILIETTIDCYIYVVDDSSIFDHKTEEWDTTATNHKNEYALNLMTCYPFDAIKTKDMYIVYTSLQKGTVFDPS